MDTDKDKDEKEDPLKKGSDETSSQRPETPIDIDQSDIFSFLDNEDVSTADEKSEAGNRSEHESLPDVVVASRPSSGIEMKWSAIDIEDIDSRTSEKDKNSEHKNRDEKSKSRKNDSSGLYAKDEIDSNCDKIDFGSTELPTDWDEIYTTSLTKLDDSPAGQFKSQPKVGDFKIKPPVKKNENEARGNWSGPLDFLVSSLGFAIGIGNIWRFSYLCFKYGRVVFIIPYFITLMLVGLPLMFLEISLGQFTSAGILTCWQFAPVVKGIGVSMMIIASLRSIYYSVTISWSVFYLYSSLAVALPWQFCDKWWNGPYCASRLKKDAVNCTLIGLIKNSNGVCYNGSEIYGLWNETRARAFNIFKTSATEDYLYGFVLGTRYSEGVNDLGPARWSLVLCHGVVWLLILLCLAWGIKSLGKVAYVTVLIPFVALVSLLVRGLTMDGSMDGIRWLLDQQDWSVLLTSHIWREATAHVFFSLSLAYGGYQTLASYNNFKNNCFRDSIIITMGSFISTIVGTSVTFTMLGHLAGKQNTTVASVIQRLELLPVQDFPIYGADKPIGFMFMLLPEAISHVLMPTLWLVMLFIMLIALGLDTQMVLVETVVTGLVDRFRLGRLKRLGVLIFSCVTAFALSLIMFTNGGVYMKTLMEHGTDGWPTLITSVLFCMSIVYLYSVCRYKDDVTTMLGRSCCCWNWFTIALSCLCWGLLSPAALVFVFVMDLLRYVPISSSPAYPMWADILVWLTRLFSILSIIFYAVVMYFSVLGRPTKRFRKLFTPNKFWGPALIKHRALLQHRPGFVIDPWNDDILSTLPDEEAHAVTEIDEAETSIVR